MIDNFKEAVALFDRLEEGYSYYIEVVTKDGDLFKDYCIDNKEKFIELEPSIKELCNFIKGTARIYINPRNYNDIAIETISKIAFALKIDNPAKASMAYRAAIIHENVGELDVINNLTLASKILDIEYSFPSSNEAIIKDCNFYDLQKKFHLAGIYDVFLYGYVILYG